MTRNQRSLSRVIIWGLIALAFFAYNIWAADDAAVLESEIIVLSDPKPKFPLSLWERDIVTGRATIVITVNQYGGLEDWLVIEATHRDLVSPIEEVIPQWSFQPAVVGGLPVTATQKISVFFDVSHLKVKNRESASDTIMGRPYASWKRGGNAKSRKNALKLAEVDEIDRYPEVVMQYQPLISNKTLEQSLGSNVTFKFFIDTDGRVRMSTLYKVQGNPDPEAILAAHAALSSWQFKPIKSKGKPVIFEAAQTFEFSSLYAARD